jgi:hypothetical protein
MYGPCHADLKCFHILLDVTFGCRLKPGEWELAGKISRANAKPLDPTEA